MRWTGQRCRGVAASSEASSIKRTDCQALHPDAQQPHSEAADELLPEIYVSTETAGAVRSLRISYRDAEVMWVRDA
ncbi:MAG: hypothetical protein QM658_14850 [Gordonia sp. (in: high G+C Gram-positive bacteria)]